ncbi:MAG: M23 family metallopeptidase [Terriglobales bacterium]
MKTQLGSRLLIACVFIVPISLVGQSPHPPKSAPFPLQLEMRVPFEPTAFPSEGTIHLMYELHLTNFGATPLYLRRMEVLDPEASGTEPIAAFDAEQLGTMLQVLGTSASPDASGNPQIVGGGNAIAFVSIALSPNSRVPDRLLHRVVTTDSFGEGAVIVTHHTTLHVLGPPVEGANWLASDGPSNDRDNHHRRGIFVLYGQAGISRRYAIDWEQVERDASFSGDARDLHSYYAYGKPVLAVADGDVVTAKDGLPDNVPGHGESFHPAVPITLETVGGNTITLNLGGGQFAYYMHLQPGSLHVKSGDRVRRGQVLARIGCSGDAREPHVHFEVTTSPKLGAGEGVPYLIDRYCSRGANGKSAELHAHELPLDKSVVTFGEDCPK